MLEQTAYVFLLHHLATTEKGPVKGETIFWKMPEITFSIFFFFTYLAFFGDWQYGQMAGGLFVQNLAIYSNEKLTNCNLFAICTSFSA